MSKSIRPTTFIAFLALGSLFAGTSAHAVSPALQARSLQGQLIAAETEKGWIVEGPGTRQAIPSRAAIDLTALVSHGDRWYAAGMVTDEATPSLVAFQGSGTGVKALPAPATTGTHLASPRLTTTREGLGMLAWLEGEDREHMAVRAAAWQGNGWSEPIEVAPGDNTQLALSAAGLSDGSTLLAWAWFDGTDDEIAWSRFDGQRWSPRRRAADNNDVPDITPSIIARPEGAWLVWSRYDGNDYRVNFATLGGGAWSDPQVIGGPGSLFPAFIEGDTNTLMIYATAVPRTWSVAEMGTDGTMVRQTSMARTMQDRPVVLTNRADQVELRWSGMDTPAPAILRWQADGQSVANEQP